VGGKVRQSQKELKTEGKKTRKELSLVVGREVQRKKTRRPGTLIEKNGKHAKKKKTGWAGLKATKQGAGVGINARRQGWGEKNKGGKRRNVERCCDPKEEPHRSQSSSALGKRQKGT